MTSRGERGSKYVWQTLLLSSVLIYAGAGMAQEDEAEDEEVIELIEVAVTGSRIKKTEIEGASPVFVITAEDIQNEGFVTVYDALNSLTQTTGITQGEVFTNQFTPAAPQLNLRGLGPGRTLYLLNGRRFADYPFPYNGQSNFVNLQQIPTAAVERIEVLSGGASAIYGSDAVAGVINVVTKKNFEGHLATVRYGTTTEGGGDNWRAQLTGGFAGERWSAVYAVEYFDRDAIFGNDRDYLDEFTDLPQIVQANSRSLLYISDRFAFDWDGNGLAYEDPGQAACDPFVEFEYSTRPGFGNYCGREDVGDESIRNQRSALSLYGNFNFDITDNTSLFIDFLYSDSDVESSGFRRFWASPSSFWNPGDTGVNGDAGRLFVGIPASLALLQRIFQPSETGNQSNIFEEDSLDLALGVRGSFAGGTWDWEASYNHSEYNSFNEQFYFKEELIDAYFLGELVPELSAFGIPWYDVPADWYERFYTPMTPDQVAGLSGKLNDDAESSNDTIQAIFTGDLFELPAGSLAFAGVAEWATQEYQLRPDARTLDQTGNGWWGRSGTGGGGKRDRYALGGEFSVPVTSMLTLPLAVRYDKYDDDSDVDDAVTWKAGFEFRPLSTVLIRGTYGTSFRAPDMHFLFAGDSGFFTSVTDYYLCRSQEGDVPTPNCTHANDQIAGNRSGNINLEEEEGESWTLGFVWAALDNLNFSADLYNIELKGIVNDLSIDGLLQDEADCRLGVTVGGTPIDINSIECQRILARITRVDIPGAPNDGTITDITIGPINRSLQEQTGIDATVDYSMVTDRFGIWSLSATYTHVLESKIQEFPEDEVQDNWRDDPGNFEFRHRFRGSVGWQIADFNTVFSGFHVGSIPNWLETDRLDPQWTFNLTVAWDITDAIRISAIGSNIFNQKPELDPGWPSWPGFSGFNYSPVGREIWAQIDFAFGR